MPIMAIPARKERNLVGWKECVDFPEWGVRHLKAKIDTGARTSALHVEDATRLPGGRIRFYVVLDRRAPRQRVRVETRVRREGRVRSSSGHYTTRVFVATTLRLGGIEKRIELNLVDREDLSFRLLLGRTALAGDFLIDVHQAYVLGKPPPRKRRKVNT